MALSLKPCKLEECNEQKELDMTVTSEADEEIVFHKFGAWDFPMSRSEKVRHLLTVFETESNAAEKEASALRAENEALKQRLADISAHTVADVPTASRRKSCTFNIPDSPREAAPTTPTTPPIMQTPGSPRAISPPRSPAEQRQRRYSEHPVEPIPRRRRRTTIFHLPPEPGEAANTEDFPPMRAKRRTCPPSASALAAAQAAGDARMADVALRGAEDWRRQISPLREEKAVSSFTPPSSSNPSPAASPRAVRCGSPAPPPRSPPIRCGSPPPPSKSPPIYGGRGSVKLCSPPPHTGLHPNPQQIGSVTAVTWCENQGIHWLRLQTQESDHASVAQDAAGAPATGRFQLNPGEYITCMGGRVEVATGRAAEWILVVTSAGRNFVMGSEEDANAQEPSFVFKADDGQEICGVIPSPTGCIHNFVQRPLR